MSAVTVERGDTQAEVVIERLNKQLKAVETRILEIQQQCTHLTQCAEKALTMTDCRELVAKNFIIQRTLYKESAESCQNQVYVLLRLKLQLESKRTQLETRDVLQQTVDFLKTITGVDTALICDSSALMQTAESQSENKEDVIDMTESGPMRILNIDNCEGAKMPNNAEGTVSLSDDGHFTKERESKTHCKARAERQQSEVRKKQTKAAPKHGSHSSGFHSGGAVTHSPVPTALEISSSAEKNSSSKPSRKRKLVETSTNEVLGTRKRQRVDASADNCLVRATVGLQSDLGAASDRLETVASEDQFDAVQWAMDGDSECESCGVTEQK